MAVVKPGIPEQAQKTQVSVFTKSKEDFTV